MTSDPTIRQLKKVTTASDSNAALAKRFLCAATVLTFISNIKFLAQGSSLTVTDHTQGYIEIGCVAAGVLLAAAAVTIGRLRVAVPGPFRLCALFALLSLGASVNSWNPALSFVNGVKYTVTLLLLSVVTTNITRISLERWIYWTVVVILASGLVTGLLLPSFYPLFRLEEMRVRLTVFLMPPGYTANLVGIAIFCGWLAKPRFHKAVSSALLVVMLATVARVFIVLFVLFGLVAVVAISWRRHSSRIVLVFGFLLVLGAASPLYINSLATTMKQSLDANIDFDGLTSSEQGEGLNGRVPMWEELIGNLSARNIIGYGFDGARDYIMSTNSWGAVHAHNSILESVYVGGYPGATAVLAAFVLATCQAAYANGHSLRWAVILALSTFTILANMTESFLVRPPLIGLILLSILISEREAARRAAWLRFAASNVAARGARGG